MEDKAFSSIDLVGQCLIDEVRTNAFEKAIKNVVKKEHTVLDIGTGSGILALFAAKSEAKKVYAIEFDSYVANIAKSNFIGNGYENKINLIVDDARVAEFASGIRFDVVIMEMLTTGMVDEFQVQAINNLYKQGVISDSTIFIPKIQETYISLAEMNFKIYGFKMAMVKHLWNGLSQNQKYEIKSENKLLNTISFDKKNEEQFSATISINILKSGIVNCVYISSKTFLTDKIILEDTETLNSPVAVPIKEKHVNIGEEVKIEVSYIFGKGFQNFKAKIS